MVFTVETSIYREFQIAISDSRLESGDVSGQAICSSSSQNGLLQGKIGFTMGFTMGFTIDFTTFYMGVP